MTGFAASHFVQQSCVPRDACDGAAEFVVELPDTHIEPVVLMVDDVSDSAACLGWRKSHFVVLSLLATVVWQVTG